MKKSELDQYNQNGYLILRGFLSEADINDLRLSIAGMVRHACGLKQSKNLDRTVINISKTNRPVLTELYDTGSRNLYLYKIATSKKIQKLSRTVLGSSTLSLSALSMRIDLPNEDDKLIDWHQDYPFIQDSPGGLVFWFPIFNVQKNSGGVRLIPGSHKDGIIKVKNRSDRRGWFLEPENYHSLESKHSVCPYLLPGDLLIMSNLIMHKSAPNRSRIVRWTGQFRIGDFLNPVSISKKWPRGYLKGESFEERHSEYVIKSL
jgi:ectoine hydroxylase-related dioxygenase (phytanoyl-CoA dioxygenase family)